MSESDGTAVTLEAVGVGYDEMCAISRESDAWTAVAESPAQWRNTQTGEIVTASTPEGVPDNYVYVSPSEEVPDGYDVVESQRGATYRSREPVDDINGDEDRSDENTADDDRQIADDELRTGDAERDLEVASVEGSEADVEAVLESYGANEVTTVDGDTYHRIETTERSDPEVAVKYSNGDAEAVDFNDLLRDVGDGYFDDISYEDILGYDVSERLEDQIYQQGGVNYHATTPEAAVGIITDGELQTRDETRGMSNQSMGRAVFTSDASPVAAYGDVVFEVDIDAMKDNGYTPDAGKEPAVEEAIARESVAREFFIPDFRAQVEQGISRDTEVFYDDMPLEYLRLDADEETVGKIRSDIEARRDEGEISPEEYERAIEFLEDSTTSEAITSESNTPEGVPDNYVYVSPSEEVPDGYDVVESQRGATYRSPQPTTDTGEDMAAPDADGDDGDGERPTPEEATNSAELGAALGFDIPAHEVLTEGDTVTVDTEGIPEGYGLPDEAEGYIRFIDNDWVEIASGDVIQTFPIERIRSADVASYRGKTGTDKLVEAVPGATATDLAGGVAAAIDDDRDDFHDIRNAVVDADEPMDAAELLAEELTDAQLNDLVDEVQTQQRLRNRFDVVDDAGQLAIGQRILYDADRPKRGTVDDVDADGTVWLYDPNRDMRSGINPEFGTVYADPDYDTGGGSFTAERGRHGLASNPEVLENAFEAADDVTGSREAGIKGGNTTGDKMKIMDMPDGSRVFATPVDAYPGPTGVVDSREEAVTNNTYSPNVIEALGGTAAQTRTMEGPDGREYIAKEGIPGQTFSEWSQTPPDEAVRLTESNTNTRAAAYFVGNRDLHGGNMVVDEDGKLTVIDHDSAGFSSDAFGPRRVADISRYNRLGADVPERVYDLAQEIRSGDRDLGVPDYSDHADYANAAAEKAVRQAYLDPTYDLPEDQTPAELQFPPSGIYELDDLRDPNDVPDESYGVKFVADDADEKEGELLDIQEDGTIVVEVHGRVTTFTDLNRLTEVYD